MDELDNFSRELRILLVKRIKSKEINLTLEEVMGLGLLYSGDKQQYFIPENICNEIEQNPSVKEEISNLWKNRFDL
jgi:hypothetical protein